MKPLHHLVHRPDAVPRRQNRPRNQDDRQVQRACGGKFCARSGSAGILRDNMADTVAVQQGSIPCHAKRPPRNQDACIRQRQDIRLIDQTQDIVMLRFRGEQAQILASDCQKNPGWRLGQGIHRGLYVPNHDPAITGYGNPRGTLNYDQRQAQGGAGRNRVPAHPGGEGVGRIDDMRDLVVGQVGLQPFDTPETPDPRRNGLFNRLIGSPRIGIRGRHSRSPQRMGKQPCLGRTTQKQDIRHG